MKLKNLFLPLLVGSVFALASCDEADTNSDMPRFSGFEYEVPVVAGDTLTVVAKQSQLGKLIGSATYDWVCLYDWTNEEEGTSGQLDTLEHQFKKVYYSIDSSDPNSSSLFQRMLPDWSSPLPQSIIMPDKVPTVLMAVQAEAELVAMAISVP